MPNQTESYQREAAEWAQKHALVSRETSQAFFAELLAEASKPAAGDQFKDFVKAILLRAQERGLYAPGE